MAPSASDKFIQCSAVAVIANFQALLKQYQKQTDVPPH